MPRPRRFYAVYLLIVILALINIILFNSYLDSPTGAKLQSLNPFSTEDTGGISFGKSPNLDFSDNISDRSSTVGESEIVSADMYESVDSFDLTESGEAADLTTDIENQTYQLYYLKPEDRQLLTTKLEAELLNTLLSLDKPEPLGKYYYVTHIDSEGGDLLVSIATRQLEEVTDTTYTDPEDFFFTVKLSTGKQSSVDLFQESSEVELVRSRYHNYQLPWRPGEGWKVEHINPNTGKWWGWHRDSHGPALDFNPPAGSSLDILASAPGKVTWKCSDRFGQAAMHVRTIDGRTDYGETLRYYHLNKYKVYVGTHQSVKQGQVLGQLSAIKNNRSDPACRLPSDTVHLHFGFPYTPITFGEYTFVENGQLYAGKKLYAQQPPKIKIAEPKANATLDLNYRYTVRTDLDFTRDKISDAGLLAAKTVSKMDLYEDGQLVQSDSEVPFEFVWYPGRQGQIKLKVRVHYADGSAEFSAEQLVNVRLPRSDWVSDKNVKLSNPVALETDSDGLLVQKFLDNQGRLNQRKALTEDIVKNPSNWSEWQVIQNPSESVNLKTSSLVAETRRGSDGNNYIRLKTLAGSLTEWLMDSKQVKFDPDVLEHNGRLYQTVVGMDGYIYWKEIHFGT